MFSTILNEVTGYFDRRAIISAFFPNLVFWALATFIILAIETGFITAFKTWEELTVAVQAFLLITFFVWISFWTFLTLNFRVAVVRIFEGYWPNAGISARLFKWKREQWQSCWDELDKQDKEFEKTEIMLISESESYAKLRSTLYHILENTETEIDVSTAEQISKEIEAFLEETELSLKELETEPLFAEEIVKIRYRVQEWWLYILPYLKDCENNEKIWLKHKDRLLKVTEKLEAMVKGSTNYGETWLKHRNCLLKKTDELEAMEKGQRGEIEKQHFQQNYNHLRDESNACTKLRCTLHRILENNETEIDASTAEQVSKELGTFLKETELRLVEIENEPFFTEKLVEIRYKIQEWWLHILPYVKVYGNYEKIWRRHKDLLLKITGRSEAVINRLRGVTKEQRLRLNHELFLYYPPNRDDIMPTRLGNVLKSSEMYSKERYHLDAIVIWPRLQPTFSKDFADPLEDAKTSLDLMVTLSTFIMLFGLPLSMYVAVKSNVLFVWWIPLILLIASLSLRFFVAATFATFALILIFIPLTIPFPSFTVDMIQIFLTLSSSVLLLAWITYKNSIEAGVAYGEKIKAAFDLYRWKVLEGFHLQIPKDLEEEQKIWDELCGLLQRSYMPDTQYFRYVLPDGDHKTYK